MAASPIGVLVPGWGAPARLYGPGLPPGWRALEPPPIARSRGFFDFYRDWIADELSRFEEPIRLAGHSMGGALAITAAAREPERVCELVLVSPAGLPLSKPMWRILADFACAVVRGRIPAGPLRDGVVDTLRSPRSALALSRSVRALDLSVEMTEVRSHGIPSVVVGCRTDTLIPPCICRPIAEMLGAHYRELGLEGGHLWLLRRWDIFRSQLEAGVPESRAEESPVSTERGEKCAPAR
jgi:pimeloyl-ACP methyl ester carboxylesterase